MNHTGNNKWYTVLFILAWKFSLTRILILDLLWDNWQGNLYLCYVLLKLNYYTFIRWMALIQTSILLLGQLKEKWFLKSLRNTT